MAINDFRVLVYTSYSDLTLLADLTHSISAGTYSTQLHGGPSIAKLTARVPLNDIWLYLRNAAQQGRHFAHLVIWEGLDWRWEGRIVDIGAAGEREEIKLQLTVLGYYSSLRDEEVQTDKTYSSKTIDFMIKDLLTTYCPSINSDQAGIEAISGNLSPTFTARQFVQDIIVKDIAPLGDSSNNVYHFTIGEDRKPFYKKRDLSNVHWEARLADMATWELRQGSQNARKTIRAHDGTTLHDAQNADNWPSAWPDRDLVIDVPAGVGATAANDAAKRAADEKGKVQNTGTVFTIAARPIRLATVNPPLGSRSAIKAGEVMRVVDLFTGFSASSITLDQLRTFYIGSTTYDMVEDVVEVTADDPPESLDILIARQGVELKR